MSRGATLNALLEPLCDSIAPTLLPNREIFKNVIREANPPISIRLHPEKSSHELPLFDDAKTLSSVPWSALGHYLHPRPSFTFDPLFHAGCYYVQEASSMFLEQAVMQHVDTTAPMQVLDLCAAPGGKSTHLQSLLSPESLLVSNEISPSRNAVLRQNLTKWGASNVVVTQNDAGSFAKLPGFFDLIVVDAPCSGSGLLRKDPEAAAHWSPAAVEACAIRQSKILQDVWPALKAGGLLIYSTCSYSYAENEAVVDAVLSDAGAESLRIKISPEWGVEETVSERTGAWGYRLYPHLLAGEGFFLSVVRKLSVEEAELPKGKNLQLATAAERSMLKPWLDDAQEAALFKNAVGFSVVHPRYLSLLSLLSRELYIKSAGVEAAQIHGQKVAPSHALALSTWASPEIKSLPLTLKEAIRYLQGEPPTGTGDRGWRIVTYGGQSLGWANALGNRTNNYYPKELRIRKRSDEA